VNTQQPTPTTPMVVPSILVAGQQTQVTVTCFVRGADASTQVQIFSLAGGSSTLVGSMNDSGQNGDQTAGDHVYTIVATLTPPASISLPLQVVATEGTASSLNVSFWVPLAQVPTYATNTDVNQAESSIYNTAIQVGTSFPTTDWTNPIQQQTFINNLVSMYGEFSGIVQQNAALQAAVQQVKAGTLPRASVTSPQPEGVLQSILDFFVPFLGPAQNASSCNLLVDSIPGNPNYGKYSFPMLAPDDPDMQAFAQQMANASQGLFTQNDFQSNDSNAYTAYLWAADYLPTHQLSPGIGGCGQSTVQSLANVAVTSEIGQFTNLAGGTFVSQAGGGEIAQQIAGRANDIAVGLMVDSSGNPNAVIGQMTPNQTIAAPAGTYNLAVSFGGDAANATLTNTPVYPNSVTNISPSSGIAITVTPPYVTGLTPAIGIDGTAVVVTGTGFDPTASNNEVTFNGTTAQVDSSTSATIQTSVPAGASSGPVSVTTSSGSTTSSLLFTVTGSAGNPPPTIMSLFPNTATVGATSQLLSISGTGFVASSTATFNGVSHPVAFLGTNRVTVMLTASDLATAGSYPVVVSNPAPGGGASNKAIFTVTSTPPVGAGMWTWMSGSNIASQPGVYGTQGVPAAGNVPSAREGAVSWSDSNGNLWLFGGLYVRNDTAYFLNDLWEFNPSTNKWTWVSGSNSANQPGIYGTLGVPASGNVPGGRFDSVAWMDSNGDFWIYGGAGYDSTYNQPFLNDLWEFNPITREWTWMGGPSLADVANNEDSASNIGGRLGAVSWLDGTGDIWIFGGYGRDTNNTAGDENDLWKFDPKEGQWILVSGSVWVVGASPVYGTIGTFTSGNVPGGRDEAVSWMDNSGNLWLFGGENILGGSFNDLWEFNPSINEWSWMSGSNTLNAVGVYGTIGVPSAGNVPSAREGAVSWTDSNGNFWLFGGRSYWDGSGGNLNDTWEFSPTTKEWSWMSGSLTFNAVGVYGTLGVPNGANIPGARSSAVSWTDNSGNIWIFGGQEYSPTWSDGDLNDLWRYQP
jgi:N-acetylneuraminic acid mutarotase